MKEVRGDCEEVARYRFGYRVDEFEFVSLSSLMIRVDVQEGISK